MKVFKDFLRFIGLFSLSLDFALFPFFTSVRAKISFCLLHCPPEDGEIKRRENDGFLAAKETARKKHKTWRNESGLIKVCPQLAKANTSNGFRGRVFFL